MHRTFTRVFAVVCIIGIAASRLPAQDSRQYDSLALVAIISANGGLSWNTATPINTWSGVTAGAGAADRVTSLYIGNKNLGAIPVEIGNLTKMESFTINNNGVGEIPAEIGKCAALTNLIFDNNYLVTLPKEIGNLTNLIYFSILQNTLELLPKEIGSLSKLTDLYLDNNNLSSLPAEMGSLSSLAIITLDNNMLHFADIELMKGFVAECYYSPQKNIGTASNVTVASGSKIGVKVRGSKNHYAWTKDGSSFGTDADSVAVTAAGVYVCTITSDSIKNLTLTHEPITVTTTSILTQVSRTPQSDFLMIQNSQNRRTTINYQVPVISHVTLAVYDIAGQKVSTLVSKQQQPGNYRYEWNSGALTAGTYFCTLNAGDLAVAKKLIVIE